MKEAAAIAAATSGYGFLARSRNRVCSTFWPVCAVAAVSGSLNHRKGTSAKPARPPTTNMVRQSGITMSARKAVATAPAW